MGTLDDGRECDELAEMIAKYGPARVIIEAPLEPYIGGKAADGSPAVRRAIVISLLSVARLSGELRQTAKALGIWCEYVDAATVRKLLGIHGRTEQELDRAVKVHIAMMVSGWPKVSNVDERDAAAACLYAARLPIGRVL
jgi:hypothetical protein